MGKTVNQLDMCSPEQLKLRRDGLLGKSVKGININPKLKKLGWIDSWLCKRLIKHLCEKIVVYIDKIEVVDDIGIIHHAIITFQKSGWDVVCTKNSVHEVPYSLEYVESNQHLFDYCSSVRAEFAVSLEKKRMLVKLRAP